MRGFGVLVAVLGVGLGVGLGACFVEPAEPATFRFECSADADCDSAEECNNGLCQQACGGADDVDCPTSAPLCLNGYCSSVCPLSEEFDDVCPPPQTCTSLTLPGEEPGDSGVCTVACDDETAPCPDGQVCFADFGVCVAVCMSADDCGSGEDCTGGFCVPSSSGGSVP